MAHRLVELNILKRMRKGKSFPQSLPCCSEQVVCESREAQVPLQCSDNTFLKRDFVASYMVLRMEKHSGGCGLCDLSIRIDATVVHLCK